MAEKKVIKFRIWRYNPDSNGKPTYKEYDVPLSSKVTTVLDALDYIKANLDHTLSFRASCRMAICGSDGMIINGKPMLACQARIDDLTKNTNVIEIRPMENYKVIRDVVPDLTPLFEKHKKVKPYLIYKDEKEQFNPTGEFIQSREELDLFNQFTYCIKCGLCYSACPVVSADEEFLGPQALAQAFRYCVDSRDQGFEERLKILDDKHGVWGCHFSGSCSAVCPKGVDPAQGIQLLKQLIIAYRLGVRKVKHEPVVKPLNTEFKPNPKIPLAPPFTAKKA